MRLLIMGPPGAGKGSQAVLIKEYYKIPSISTGDMFRKHIKNNTELGKLANSYISKGNLVPDDVTIGIVRDRLRENDCGNGFLLDGFPRNIYQADALEQILHEHNTKIDLVINLEVEEDILIKRISGRRMCKNCGASYHVETLRPKKDGICDLCGSGLYQRSDDNEHTVKNRIKIYFNETEPLLEYYQKRNLLVNIDGARTVGVIFEDLKKLLGGINDFN
jgi:adenylate kinase